MQIIIPCSDRHFYCVNRNKRQDCDQYFIYKISINYCTIKMQIVIPCSDSHFYCVNPNKQHYCDQYFVYKSSINYCLIKMQMRYRVQTCTFIE